MRFKEWRVVMTKNWYVEDNATTNEVMRGGGIVMGQQRV